MPCAIDGDDAVPLAQFGTSNVGRMKTIYRNGLGMRYGRMMQAISGVHFNYSFPRSFWEAFAAAARVARQRASNSFPRSYFDLLRNYRRYGWIVLYLFGVSPVVCKSFLRGRDMGLRELTPGTLYEPYATSLRMSDIGYRNRNQAGLSVSVNSLDEYVRDLTRAITTPHAPYEAIGVKVKGLTAMSIGQLNANILQIENEYYSFIRPKRVARSGERPTKALQRAGVEYVEVRALDVSAFDPVGVNQNKLRFLEAFLAHVCAARTARSSRHRREARLDQNHLTVARRGREPGLMLWRDGREVPMRDWARELLDSMTGICEVLDRRRSAASLRQRAGGAGGETRRRGADAVRAAAERAHSPPASRSSTRHCACRTLHKDYFLEMYRAERGAAGGVRGGGGRIPGTAAAAGDRQARSLSIPTWPGILRNRSQIPLLHIFTHINFHSLLIHRRLESALVGQGCPATTTTKPAGLHDHENTSRRTDDFPASGESRERRFRLPVVTEKAASGWDAYEVWRTRIKAPQDSPDRSTAARSERTARRTSAVMPEPTPQRSGGMPAVPAAPSAGFLRLRFPHELEAEYRALATATPTVAGRA